MILRGDAATELGAKEHKNRKVKPERTRGRAASPRIIQGHQKYQ